jgi:hypothetical protein
MYKVLIRPVLSYASETRILSKANERRLSLFERKVLPCIFGAKRECHYSPYVPAWHGERQLTFFNINL